MVVLLYKKRPDLLVKMRVIKPEEVKVEKMQNCGAKVLLVSLLTLCLLLPISAVSAQESKWVGVDESVVERYAKEHGRKAREPIINTNQGDLLLCVFLLAGAISGFVAGYCYKTLMEGE